MQAKPVSIDLFRIDGGTQSRTSLNSQAVTEYAEAIADGVDLPPVVAFFDGSSYWLADGFHRFHGHRQAGKESILADVRTGTQRDAVLFSAGANNAHGLRRTNEDKRNAVAMVLADMEWCRWPEKQIAAHCHVSRSLVKAVIESLHLVEKQDDVREVTRNGKTYQQDVSGIKAKAVKPAASDQQDEVGLRVDQAKEAQDLVQDLSRENDELRQQLSVEAGGSEAAQTLQDLQSKVSSLEVELQATRNSRDDLAIENSELKKQVAYWRKKFDAASSIPA